jgi:DNA-binding protein YbaB
MELRAQAQKVQTELDRLTQLISELEVEDSADGAGASRRASGGDVSREAGRMT